MGRLGGFRYREIAKRLKAAGFEFHRQAAGSHKFGSTLQRVATRRFPTTAAICPRAHCGPRLSALELAARADLSGRWRRLLHRLPGGGAVVPAGGAAPRCGHTLVAVPVLHLPGVRKPVLHLAAQGGARRQPGLARWLAPAPTGLQAPGSLGCGPQGCRQPHAAQQPHRTLLAALVAHGLHNASALRVAPFGVARLRPPRGRMKSC